MRSVMGLYHTQPWQVPSTPPFSDSLADHFLNLMPTEAESMVVQQEDRTTRTRTVTEREIQVDLAMALLFFIRGVFLNYPIWAPLARASTGDTSRIFPSPCLAMRIMPRDSMPRMVLGARFARMQICFPSMSSGL